MRVTTYGCLWLRHRVPGAGAILPLILLAAVQARPHPQQEPLPTSSPGGDPGPSSSVSSRTSPLPSPTSASASASASAQATTFTSSYITTLSSGQPRPTGAPSTGSVWATYTIYTTTLSPSPTASTSAPTPSSTADGNAGMAASSDDLPLNTRIDAAFGVLGVVMIITGGALAVRASRSRWILYFVSAFYWFALVTLCMIFKLGIERAIFDPSPTTRGLFLLACLVVGIIGGVLALFWHAGAALLAASLGGLSLGLFIQALHRDGLIQQLVLRWALYLGCIAVFFSIAVSKRIQPLVLLAASALTGSTIVMLGIDCYTTAGLKEFYARNLLGDQLFADRHRPTFEHGQFPLPQAVQIELGVIGGCTLMSLALQSKMFAELRANLRALKSDDEDRRINAQARRASQHVFRNAQRDLAEWERRHGYRTDDPELGSQGTPTEEKASDNRSHFARGSFTRNNSGQSLSPIPEAGDEFVQRSIFYGATAPARSNSHVSFADSVKGLSRNENVGRSDTMYAGNAVRFPTAVAAANPARGDDPPARSADLQERQRLLDEIANIRQSISSLHSALPAGTPPSAPEEALSATGSYHAPLRGDGGRRSVNFAPGTTSSKPAPWTSDDRTKRSRVVSAPMLPSLLSLAQDELSQGFRTMIEDEVRLSSPEDSLPTQTSQDGVYEPQRSFDAGRRFSEQGPRFDMSAELQADLAFPPTAPPQLRPLHLPARTGANSPEASVGRGMLDAPEPRASKTQFDLTAKAPDSPRRVINGTVPASRRRSTLSYRNSSIDWPADAVKGIANESGPSGAVHMTMAELQERHKAKLAAKQSRVSATFELELAKQHWEQKVAEERKTMHLRERVRAHEAAVAAAQAEEQLRQQASTGAAQSQYRRSMNQLLILGERDGSVKKDERSDATQRAKEWRQSVRLSKDGASSMDRFRRSRPTSMTLDHQPELSNDPTVRPASAGGFNKDQNHKATYDKLVSSQAHAEVSERYPSKGSANLEKVHRMPKGELTELDRRRISQGALGRPLNGSASNKTLLDFENTAIVDQAWNKRTSRTVAGK